MEKVLAYYRNLSMYAQSRLLHKNEIMFISTLQPIIKN